MSDLRVGGLLFTALNSGILFRIKEGGKKGQVPMILLLGLINLSAEAGVGAVGLTKAGRVTQPDRTA